MVRNYDLFEKDKIILRDYLAKERTVLANERTYLAYLRTFVSLFAAGIGLLKYMDEEPITQVLGWVFIVSSVLLLLVGTIRFVKIKKPLKNISPQRT